MQPVLAAFCILPLAVMAQQCYYPNGDEDTNGKPCGGGGSGFTPCCYGSHYCLDNGLCFAKSTLTMYRGSCTDPDFQSSRCGQYCKGSDSQGGVDNSHSGVWTCGDDLFSCHSAGCGSSNFTVSGAKLLFNEALENDVGELTASGSVSGSVAAQTVTTTVTTTTTTTPDPEASSSSGSSSDGISTAAAAGIGAGVGVPLAIAVVSLLFLLFRERRQRKDYQNKLMQASMTAGGYGGHPGGERYYATPATGTTLNAPHSGPAELKDTSRYELQS